MDIEKACPECGRLQNSWRDPLGYGLKYCCRDCAEAGACTCDQKLGEVDEQVSTRV